MGMRYPGGKGRCFQHLISLMPPHRVYIETHLGGGAVLRHKRPSPATIGIDRDPSVIAAWDHAACPGVDLHVDDAVAFLERYAFVGDELVYCDPPYLPETRRKARLYRYEYTVAQHEALIATLRRLPCAVILSGYPSDFYDARLSDWVRVTFPGDSHVGPRLEAAWLNYEPPTRLHDYGHVGATFRERERIRRRRGGLMRRIAGLDPVERNALFANLADDYGDALATALTRRSDTMPQHQGPPT